ncbi:SLATT domain-containing protein [Magnetococcales bacterium HHB-1]
MALPQEGTPRHHLWRKMWQTKGVRYLARERLLKMNQRSAQAIASMSVSILVISLLLLCNLVPKYSNILELFTVFLSISILVLSLLEHAEKYELRAFEMYRCANEIGELYDELSQTGQDDEEKVNGLRKRYWSVIKAYPENHSMLDYQLFSVFQSDSKLSKAEKQFVKLRYFTQYFAFYWLLMLTPIWGWAFWFFM